MRCFGLQKKLKKKKKKLQGVEGFVSFVNLFRTEKLKSKNSGSWHNVFFFSFSPLPLSGDGISLCSLRQTQAHNLPVSQMLGLQVSVTMAFSLRCFLQNRDWCVPRSYANLGWGWGTIKAPASAPALRKECCPGCGQPSHTELMETQFVETHRHRNTLRN